LNNIFIKCADICEAGTFSLDSIMLIQGYRFFSKCGRHQYKHGRYIK